MPAKDPTILDRVKEARGLVVDLHHMQTSTEAKARTERLLYLMDRITLDYEMEKAHPLTIVVTGNPFDGMSVRGPFPNHAEAIEWAEASGNDVDQWNVINLLSPEAP